jgi:branched-chain amino acid transport system substrate-binding protein
VKRSIAGLPLLSLVTVLVVYLVMASLSGCSPKPAEPEGPSTPGTSTEPIKFCFLAHVSGDGAVWGQAESNGGLLAVEEINAAGGVLGRPLELILADGRGNAADAVNAVKKVLSEHDVVAILGSNYSGVNLATGPVAAEAKVPQVSSFATNPAITIDENGNVKPWSFRLCFIDPYQGKVLAHFGYNELKKTTAAVLYNISDDYSMGLTEAFVQEFEGLGGQIVGTWAFKDGDVDFRPQLSEIKAKDPEVLLLPIYYKEIALIAKQAHELGMAEVIFMGGDGSSVKMLEMAGPELQGSYWVTHMFLDDPPVKEVYDKYTARFGESPEYSNFTMGYDMVYFLKDAIERAGKAEGQAIRDAMETAKDVQLAHASITIDPKTHNPLNKVAVIIRAEGMEFKLHLKFAPSD